MADTHFASHYLYEFNPNIYYVVGDREIKTYAPSLLSFLGISNPAPKKFVITPVTRVVEDVIKDQRWGHLVLSNGWRKAYFFVAERPAEFRDMVRERITTVQQTNDSGTSDAS